MAINLKKRTYVNKKNGSRKEYWVVTISLHHTCGTKQRKRFNRPGDWSPARVRSWAQQREAHLLAAGFESEEAEAESPAPETITFSEFAAKFVVDYPRLAGLRPSTKERYASHIRIHFNPMFGDRLLSDVGEKEYRMLASLDFTPGTRNILLAELRCMIGVAHEWGLRSPPPKPRRVKQSIAEPEWYTPAEYLALVEAAPASSHRTIILLGGDAGLRCGEMLGLRVRDVQFASGELHVCRSVWRGIPGPTKGRQDRRVPLSERLAEELRSLCAGQDLNSYVLSGSSTPLTRGAVKHRVRVCEARWRGLTSCNLARGQVHRLRHTFGSSLVRAGVNPRLIQKLMGHSSIKITERYMSVGDDQLQSAIVSLEALSAKRSANRPRATPRREKAL